MVISALRAIGRGHAPIIACFALCWKRTDPAQRGRSVLCRELAQKTPECRGKQLGGLLRYYYRDAA